MSTRSAVAVVAGDSWRGRYVHSDGYPSHLLATLIDLIARDGREAVVKKITEDRYGWSNLDITQESIEGVAPDRNAPYGTAAYDAAMFAPDSGMYGDGRFVVEPGYGVAYTEHQGQSDPEMWVTPDDDWGTEWVYVIGPRSIQVLEQTTEGAVARGSVPFDAVVDQPLLASLEDPYATRVEV